jgi:hypothetical protein
MPRIHGTIRYGVRVGLFLLGIDLAFGVELLAFHVRDPDLVGFGLVALPTLAALVLAGTLALTLAKRGYA